MFVALRDIRFAKGRFALMGAVVTLITTLVVFLYGLTGGLASAASSAVSRLPVTDVVFGAPRGAAAEVSFSTSVISPQQQRAFVSVPGIGRVLPFGVAMSRLTGDAGATSVSVLGAPSTLLPPVVSGVAPQAGQVAVSRKAADDGGLHVGDRVSLGARTLTVSGITADRSYAHAPSVWTSPETWTEVTGAQQPNALAVDPGSAAPGVMARLDQAQNTRTVSRDAALAGIDGYSAEQGSLQMIQGFLFAVSALVVGAFFTVWTVQRKPDIAVLKAVGASNAYLVRDALAQAFALLLTGALSGAALGVAGGAALSGSGMPFTLAAATVVVPVVVMVLLGLAGAVLAVRRITSVDPLTALGASR